VTTPFDVAGPRLGRATSPFASGDHAVFESLINVGIPARGPVGRLSWSIAAAAPSASSKVASARTFKSGLAASSRSIELVTEWTR